MALGVVVPELDTEATAGRFGTELALGKLQLGDPGVGEAMEINEGVAVFCGVPSWSISPGRNRRTFDQNTFRQSHIRCRKCFLSTSWKIHICIKGFVHNTVEMGKVRKLMQATQNARRSLL